jgi:hypothetical protein
MYDTMHEAEHRRMETRCADRADRTVPCYQNSKPYPHSTPLGLAPVDPCNRHPPVLEANLTPSMPQPHPTSYFGLGIKTRLHTCMFRPHSGVHAVCI